MTTWSNICVDLFDIRDAPETRGSKDVTGTDPTVDKGPCKVFYCEYATSFHKGRTKGVIVTRTRFAALGALALAGALALTGCSAGSNAASDGGTKSIGTPDGTGKTITVWMMNGDLSDKVLDAAGEQFTEDTGAKVKIQTQQWDGMVSGMTAGAVKG